MKTKNHFFSVCIPATGREQTLERCLLSLCRQTMRDFEVIISSRKDDGSIRELIETFRDSQEFKASPFDMIYSHFNQDLIGCEDWNDSIGLAKGKYIAVLEGDDIFLDNHLSQVKEKLSQAPKAILFATGHQSHSRVHFGLMSSQKFREYIIEMIDVPTPSETIFIRCIDDVQVFYDTDNYVYAPEIELYIRLSLLRPSALFMLSAQNTVWRDPYDKPMKGKEWAHYVDHLNIFNLYRKEISCLKQTKFIWRHAVRASSGCVQNMYIKSDFIQKSNTFPVLMRVLIMLRMLHKLFLKRV